jgi:hypothetical protein
MISHPAAAPAKRPLRALEPKDPFLRAAAVGVRCRGGNPFQRRAWLRVAYRLAGGMSVRQVARSERTEEAAIEALLAQDDFRELLESQRALEALPEEEQTERLVRLARIAIENALSDFDLGAAYFVLRAHGQGRDPARTLVRGLQARARKAVAPLPPPAAPRPPSAPGPCRWRDPLDALVHRQAAALRRAVVEEQAVCHAAVAAEAAAEAVPMGAAATREAARRALALKSAAAVVAPPHDPGVAQDRPLPWPAPAEPFPPAAFPRRARAP